MNLIGHYSCASVPALPVRLGSVLPDLLGHYRRKVRPAALIKCWRGTAERDSGVRELIAGLQFHHTVDVHFHRGPLFKETSSAIQEALLRASKAPGLKRFLPAHVLTELYVDHLLIGREPGLVDAFYGDLEAGRGLLTELVSAHPLADSSSFRHFLSRIIADRFVEDYRSYRGVLYCMNRILVHFSQRPLQPSEQAAVAEVFARRSGHTEALAQSFVRSMRGLLPAMGGVGGPTAARPDDGKYPAVGLAAQPV